MSINLITERLSRLKMLNFQSSKWFPWTVGANAKSIVKQALKCRHPRRHTETAKWLNSTIDCCYSQHKKIKDSALQRTPASIGVGAVGLLPPYICRQSGSITYMPPHPYRNLLFGQLPFVPLPIYLPYTPASCACFSPRCLADHLHISHTAS